VRLSSHLMSFSMSLLMDLVMDLVPNMICMHTARNSRKMIGANIEAFDLTDCRR